MEIISLITMMQITQEEGIQSLQIFTDSKIVSD
jgi:ribonuclease HI